MRYHSVCNGCVKFIFSSFILISLVSSCQLIPSTPEKLAEKIGKQMVSADSKASGFFLKTTDQLGEGQLVVLCDISRQDDPDDPWKNKHEVHFLFSPAPNDPEAPGGWYLIEIGGDYPEYLAMEEGLQFEWKYEFFQTEYGPRQGIIGVEKVINTR